MTRFPNAMEDPVGDPQQKIAKADNVSDWYLSVVQRAELADYAPVKGCMVIRPYGYAIWENIQRALDPHIRAAGVQAAYFPLFIPQSFFAREKAFAEGFSPECAVVTHGGGEQLEEPLYVRPTSETIMYYMFAKWVHSWRDLPLKLNQWCNVGRWEKRTFPFLRTLEFLWQEGHTAHATREECEAEVMRALRMYERFFLEDAAVPVMVGRKSDGEKFAGAVYTTTCEALMPDGKALQSATSHMLGQNFSRAEAFNIAFQDAAMKEQFAWQTSWGMSTRVVGALIMTHGDDAGLVLPPRIAPIQVVIVPIGKSPEEKEAVKAKVEALRARLAEAGVRVHADTREEYTPGWKFNDWELRGVPVRVELGPKDVQKGQVVIARRDVKGKEFVSQDSAPERIRVLLDEVQKALLQRALEYRASHTYEVKTLAEFADVVETRRGFVWAPWCGKRECEVKVKEQTKATSRCIPIDDPGGHPACFVCGAPSTCKPVWARAY